MTTTDFDLTMAPVPVEEVRATLDEVHAGLVDQSFLFDDPRTYEAGVEDTLAALGQVLATRHGAHTSRSPTSAATPPPAVVP